MGSIHNWHTPVWRLLSRVRSQRDKAQHDKLPDYQGTLPGVLNCQSSPWPDPTRVSPCSPQAVRWETLGTRLHSYMWSRLINAWSCHWNHWAVRSFPWHRWASSSQSVNVPVKSKLQHPTPGHTPGIWRLFLPRKEGFEFDELSLCGGGGISSPLIRAGELDRQRRFHVTSLAGFTWVDKSWRRQRRQIFESLRWLWTPFAEFLFKLCKKLHNIMLTTIR